MQSSLHTIDDIPGLKRFENFSRDEMLDSCLELTHSVYPHDELYDQFCTIQQYVDCPPDLAFRYLSDPQNLSEWTWSTRDFVQTTEPNLLVGHDMLADETKIYCRTISHEASGTIDFHCAWDQPNQMWMIYLMRVIPAQLVFNKPGTVITWTNCRHPFYDKNPFPETAPKDRDEWVGDMWPFFYAGHKIELNNLKQILEYRHANKLPIGTYAECTTQKVGALEAMA